MRFDFRGGELRFRGQLVCLVGLTPVCLFGGARGGGERRHEGVIVNAEVGTGNDLSQLGESLVQVRFGEPGSFSGALKVE